MIGNSLLRLLLCGLAALYWELTLIRWFGSCVRIVAYYSNFVLIAAFFGLGAGALLARFRFRFYNFIIPAIAISLILGTMLGGFMHMNPEIQNEYIWIGAPFGITNFQENHVWLSLWLILPFVYLSITTIFVMFGQWIGVLFKEITPPLKAYSTEILGSLIGVGLFAVFSYLNCSPIIWFIVGFLLLLLIVDRKPMIYIMATAFCVATFYVTIPFADRFIWSPYYRIFVNPISQIIDKEKGLPVHFGQTMGYALTVNNDYHQMMLDLRERKQEHPFFSYWRALYDEPYIDDEKLPPGPILIVGAGTGNDVSAALRRTKRMIYAVEIDPVIASLGEKYHPEKPYQNPRVKLIINDARTFFQQTNIRFSLVVFGFLDSHQLLSSFSSLRLDNFVYTQESMNQVKHILLPNGKVTLTFASNRLWIHERLSQLLHKSFGQPTKMKKEQGQITYTQAIIYENFNTSDGLGNARLAPVGETRDEIKSLCLPTDDWPFLYLFCPNIPFHYVPFLLLIVVMGFSALILLPKSERKIRFPYFFLGAAFFLLETSNVVSLSLLYGSTWTVNVLVFSGILILVLLGNLTGSFVKNIRPNLIFPLLFLSVTVAYFVPVSMLFSIETDTMRNLIAIIIFLGPVYFSSIIFAALIRNEQNLFQAYGSNILGAVIGGACEYLSLLCGFKFLLGIVIFFYLVTYLLLLMQTKNIFAR